MPARSKKIRQTLPEKLLARIQGVTRRRIVEPSITSALPAALDSGRPVAKKSPTEAGQDGDPNDAKLEPIFRFH